MKALLLLPLLFSTACLVETFDNTGGPKPPGDELNTTELEVSLDNFCTFDPVLARSTADIPLIEGNEGCTAGIRTALEDDFAALEADEAIVVFTLELGGCERDYELAGATREDDQVHLWLFVHSVAHGALDPGVACPADAFVVAGAVLVDGVTDADEADLVIGLVNPAHPREAEVPKFDGG